FLFQFTKHMNWNYLNNAGIPGLMTNKPIDVLDRWQVIGDSGPLQRYSTGGNPQVRQAFNRFKNSNETLSDASFIRLKTISLGYTLPKGQIKGIDCRVYIQGQNLLTFTGYDWGDPEFVGLGWLPPLRQITLGTQFTF